MRGILVLIATLLFALPPAVLAKDAGAVCCLDDSVAMAGMSMQADPSDNLGSVPGKQPNHAPPCYMAFTCSAAVDPGGGAVSGEPVRYSAAIEILSTRSARPHSVTLQPRLRPPIY